MASPAMPNPRPPPARPSPRHKFFGATTRTATTSNYLQQQQQQQQKQQQQQQEQLQQQNETLSNNIKKNNNEKIMQISYITKSNVNSVIKSSAMSVKDNKKLNKKNKCKRTRKVITKFVFHLKGNLSQLIKKSNFLQSTSQCIFQFQLFFF